MTMQTPLPLRYDGHGLNSADEFASRLLTFARHPESKGGGYILERAEQDRVGESIVRAVNSHAQLTEALRVLAVAFNAFAPWESEAERKVYEQAVAALKAAGVEL